MEVRYKNQYFEIQTSKPQMIDAYFQKGNAIYVVEFLINYENYNISFFATGNHEIVYITYSYLCKLLNVNKNELNRFFAKNEDITVMFKILEMKIIWS